MASRSSHSTRIALVIIINIEPSQRTSPYRSHIAYVDSMLARILPRKSFPSHFNARDAYQPPPPFRNSHPVNAPMCDLVSFITSLPPLPPLPSPQNPPLSPPPKTPPFNPTSSSPPSPPPPAFSSPPHSPPPTSPSVSVRAVSQARAPVSPCWQLFWRSGRVAGLFCTHISDSFTMQSPGWGGGCDW